MRALISVYDKTGVIETAKALAELGWDIVSSGGTATALNEAGVDVTPVEEITQSPEMLDGRMRTSKPFGVSSMSLPIVYVDVIQARDR